MKEYEWEELTCDQKRQVIRTYKTIRSIEEEKDERFVNIQGVRECRFVKDLDFGEDYLSVII